MRQSRWPPSITPTDEPTVHLFADDFGQAGRFKAVKKSAKKFNGVRKEK